MHEEAILTRDEAEAIPEMSADLATWVGRREAFAMMAGRCSAADAECLRQIRDSKSYKALKLSWGEFCKERLGVVRSTAELWIRNLKDFGPTYFTMAQLTGITARDYRRIANSVNGDCLQIDGEKIVIASENAKRLTEAVRQLCEAGTGDQDDPAPSSGAQKLLATAGRELKSSVSRYKQLLETELEKQDRFKLWVDLVAAGHELERMAERFLHNS